MVRLLSLLISLGLLATGCSQPSPPAAPAESAKAAAPGAAPAASPAAAPAAQPGASPAAAPRAGNTVTYSIPSPNGFHLPILVGVDKGIFDKRNVKVDMVASGTSGLAMTQALLAGSLDFAPITPATALSTEVKEPELMQI